MCLRRIRCLILIFILNLIIGFVYIEQFKFAILLRAISSNESNETLSSTTVPETVLRIALKFVINPVDLCKRGSTIKSKLSLMILVCTAVPDAEQREAIRNTWGSVASTNNNTDYVRLAFLLGSTRSGALQKQIEQEAANYFDIIQQDFIDSYQNLTLKSVMLLKWVSQYCPNVKYVLKSDGDMYVNVPNLVDTLVRLPAKSNAIFGVLFQKARPNRDPSAKWFVPKDQFDGDMFPDYVSGTAYLMSGDVVPKLLYASATVPFLVMEDIFITGLCASQCHVKLYNVLDFSHRKRPATGCAFKDAIFGHHVTAKDMYKVWKELQKNTLICDTI